MLIRNISSKVIEFYYINGLIQLQPRDFFEFPSLLEEHLVDVMKFIDSRELEIITLEFDNYDFNNGPKVKKESNLNISKVDSFKNIKLKKEK